MLVSGMLRKLRLKQFSDPKIAKIQPQKDQNDPKFG